MEPESLGASCERVKVSAHCEVPSLVVRSTGTKINWSLRVGAATGLQGQSGKTPSDSRCHLIDPRLGHSSAGAGGAKLGLWRLDRRRGPGLAV